MNLWCPTCRVRFTQVHLVGITEVEGEELEEYRCTKGHVFAVYPVRWFRSGPTP
jgi:hypothetical protein